MAAVRLVVTGEDGEVEHDEMVLISPSPDLRWIEKDITILGRRLTMRFEFDPPLLVPEPTPDDATG